MGFNSGFKGLIVDFHPLGAFMLLVRAKTKGAQQNPVLLVDVHFLTNELSFS